MTRLLRDPRADAALAACLDAARAACEAHRRAAVRTPGPHAAARGLDALTRRLAALFADAALAALTAGAWAAGGKLPGGTSDPPATPPPAPVTAAARSALDALPDGLRAEYLAAMPPELAAHFSPPADALDAFAWPEELPWVRECALALLAKGAVSLGGFRAMRDDADRHASAAAEAVAGDARRRVQQALAEAVAEGPDARAFKKRFAEELSPADAEAAFRDGMQAAYSAGLDRVLESPLVGRAYPYEENLPIRDRRLSGMCEVVSRSGLNGTAVYRRDDPVWQKLKPPRHFRCRCGRNPLTVSEAARRGVAEAREWERTGTPPAAPAFVPWPAGVEL